MNDRDPIDVRKRKYTPAYIERWIRPLPAKPTHPHDSTKRYDDSCAADSAIKRRNDALDR